MKNQHKRRDYNRNYGHPQRNDMGQFTSNGERSYGESRANHYQDRSEDNSQEYFRNRGYRDMDRNRDYGYASRRGENYGFGSQNSNESYRDFSTQGRNSGLGNQGGHSTYDEDQYRNRSDHYPNYGNLSDYDSNDRSNSRSDGYDRDYYGDQRSDAWRSSEPNNLGWRSDRSYGSNETNGDRNTSSHRGKGPKGYQRSDDRIREDISDVLSDDEQLDASEIDVKVENGEVTLTGAIAQREDKRRAEELAESVSGVKNVENRLRVPTSKDTSTSRRTEEQNGSDKAKNRQTNHAHA